MISKAKLHNSQAGFSLVELLVSVVIMSVVGIAVSEIMVVWGNSTRDNNDKQNIHREMELAMNQIDRALVDSTGAAIANYLGGTDNQITISALGGGNIVFRFDPATGALERDGANVISTNVGNSPIVADTLSFVTGTTGAAPHTRQQITTTLQLSYLEAGDTDYTVQFSMITTLRNS